MFGCDGIDFVAYWFRQAVEPDVNSARWLSCSVLLSIAAATAIVQAKVSVACWLMCSKAAPPAASVHVVTMKVISSVDFSFTEDDMHLRCHVTLAQR